MGQISAFIDREAFGELLAGVGRADGAPYQDIDTIYGDLSRLVVALMATMTPEKIISTYNELGWGGSANGRAIHEAAKTWMQKHRPK